MVFIRLFCLFKTYAVSFSAQMLWPAQSSLSSSLEYSGRWSLFGPWLFPLFFPPSVLLRWHGGETLKKTQMFPSCSVLESFPPGSLRRSDLSSRVPRQNRAGQISSLASILRPKRNYEVVIPRNQLSFFLSQIAWHLPLLFSLVYLLDQKVRYYCPKTALRPRNILFF